MYRVVLEAEQFPVSKPMAKAEAARIAAVLSEKLGERHGIAKV